MPQLNPEFFVSQLFWLVVTFSFLLLFLWRISLPRISSVLEKRESKINNDVDTAKQMQIEAEEIQKQIEQQLLKVREENLNLIKDSSKNFQNKTTEQLNKLDNELNIKINESAAIIQKNKKDSLKKINEEIHDITKLIITKLTSLPIGNDEIKNAVAKAQSKTVH